MSICYTTFNSPLGKMTIQANDDGLMGAWFETQTTQPQDLGKKDPKHPILILTINQLQEYFHIVEKCFNCHWLLKVLSSSNKYGKH